GLARRYVDDPQLRDRLIDEAGAVGHVSQSIDEVVVRFGRLAGFRRLPLATGPAVLIAGRAARAAPGEEPAAVRRPLGAVGSPWQIGQATRLAAIEREEVDLLAVLTILCLAGCRLLLDLKAPVRQECDRPAVRREPGLPVVLRPDREPARLSTCLGVDPPERVAIAVLCR